MITGILFTVVTLLVSVNYYCLILSLVIGLHRLIPNDKENYESNQMATSLNSNDSSIVQNPSKKNFVSVVIATRDEEDNIAKCLECLIKQDYGIEHFEVIIVNDHSTDKTIEIIDSFIGRATINIRLFQLKDNNRGKKAAITLGYKWAKGEIILTTDADCQVSTSWISQMNMAFLKSNSNFITGPVMMTPEDGFFNKFQCLEFNSLIASTAGSIGINMPIMSNGANMGFKRSAYNQIQARTISPTKASDPLKKSKPSGDDIFLMLSFKKIFGKKSISFLNSPKGIVITSTQKSIKEFLSQRLRWVSKSNGYKDIEIIYSSLSIFLFNLLLLFIVPISLILVPDNDYLITTPFKSFTVIFLLKFLVDFLLVQKYSSIYGQSKLLYHMLLIEPLVIIYTVGVGIFGNFISFNWKGRLYKKRKGVF